MKPTVIQAVAYLRVSGLGQVDKDGPERQRKAIGDYASAHRIEIAKEYFDAGVSGTRDLVDRPALLDLFDNCPAGVTTIIVEKLDRLARDVMVQEAVIRQFQTKGITLISTQEPDLCSNEPARRFIRQVLGAVYELEKNMIVARTKAARERVRASGKKCEGAHAYGSHPENPEESTTLRRIQELRKQGSSFGAIAAELNTSGISPRRGREWYAATVRGILLRKKTKIAA